MKKYLLMLILALILSSCSKKLDSSIDSDWQNMQICLMDGIPYAKSSQDENLIQLGDKVLAPKEWAQQDLAGRNKETALTGNPDVFAEFVSKDCGWLIAIYSRGTGSIDVYVYKTSDGGRTWRETEAPDIPWYPSAVGFIDEERLIVASKRFQNAPVFFTKDGGKSWSEIKLPDQTAAVTSIQVTVKEIVMTVEYEYGEKQLYLSSYDKGDSWQIA